ncbi:hypothetical protein RJT34_21943 [Clitoria ternatea]|uniref:TIR domain-containing protein n=1 Tax=Clitoria ternatea TaxID=43366 RepID=A0AAN9IUW6_CLITE
MSCSTPEWLYDVFLNFIEDSEAGPNTFVSRLRGALSSEGVTFIDGTNLDREIWEATIEGSHIALLLFTQNYTESSRCLDERVKIMDCHNQFGKVVVPIFYGVDRYDVREQSGPFGEALEQLAETRLPGKGVVDVLLKWGAALTQAALLTGYSHSDYSLDNTLLPVTKFFVGLTYVVQELRELIENSSAEVSFIGICGMGGVGKTTTAKFLYNNIGFQFENKSFIENIAQVCKEDNRGYVGLQKQLLYDVLKTEVELHGSAMGTTMIEKRLHGKRLLLVLDNVSELEQVKVLCGNREWIGRQSVLLGIDESESVELLSRHAFRELSPREDFHELSRQITKRCKGLPLALEIIGSCLYEKTKEEWECMLSKLNQTVEMNNDLFYEIFRLSLDGLDDEEKRIFLDICCFFIDKDRAYAAEILNSCRTRIYPNISITNLVERNLIKIEKNNKLGMHALLLEMGRKIIHQSSSKEADEYYCQGWAQKDVLDAFARHVL